MNENDKNKAGEETGGMENLMYAGQFEGLSQYRMPFSTELVGRNMNIVFDGGEELLVCFLNGETLTLSENGASAIQENYQCLKAEGSIYMVLIEKKDCSPREGIILVIDTEKSLVTGNFMQQGAVESSPRLVTREVKFGAIRRPGRELPKERHHYTTDLVGEKINYSYNPQFNITHYYRTQTHVRWGLSEEMRERIAAAGGREMPVVDEPCIYVKLNDHMYIFSWIEENGGSGTQGFIVVDIRRFIDVGCFFGINPVGKPEAYMFSAFGRAVIDKIPEEDMRAVR